MALKSEAFSKEIYELAKKPALMKKLDEKIVRRELQKLPSFKDNIWNPELMDEVGAYLEGWHHYPSVWIIERILGDMHAEWHASDGEGQTEEDDEDEEEEDEEGGGSMIGLGTVMEELKEALGFDKLEEGLQKYPTILAFYLRWSHIRLLVGSFFFRIKRGIHRGKTTAAGGISYVVRNVFCHAGKNPVIWFFGMILFLGSQIVANLIVIVRVFLNPEKGLDAVGVDIFPE